MGLSLKFLWGRCEVCDYGIFDHIHLRLLNGYEGNELLTLI